MPGHRRLCRPHRGTPANPSRLREPWHCRHRQAIDKIKNATLDDGEKAFYGAIDAAKKWLGKPTREKLGDVAEDAGETMASPTTWAAGAGAVFRGGGKALSAGADLLGETEKLGKEAKKVGKAAKRAGTAVALEDEAVHTAPAWNGAHAYHPPPRELEAFPTAKRAPLKTPIQGGGKLRQRWKDADGMIYEWDSRHGTVEKYTRQGKHIGEFDPTSGAQLKPRDPTRRVKK